MALQELQESREKNLKQKIIFLVSEERVTLIFKSVCV